MTAELSKLDNVPSVLRDLPVWLLWKSVPNGDDKPKKVPYYIDGRRRGDTDTPADRECLVSLDDAIKAYKRRYAGLGIALGRVPGSEIILSGIDTDNSVRDARIAPKVRKVLEASHDAYAEISPSGNGLKVFGTGDIGTEKTKQLEIYSGGRFFTVTGEKIQGDHLSDLTDAAAVARSLLLEHSQRKERQRHGAIPAGQRNNALYAFACSLRARNMPDAEALQALQARNLDCDPPLAERELQGIFDNAWKHPPGFALTDLGNAQRLVAHCGADLRYIPRFGSFFLFDGKRWQQDEDGATERRTKESVRRMYDEARDEAQDDVRKRLTQWALASQSAARIVAAQSLAKTEPGVPLAPEALDADPMLLGVANGILNLNDGSLRDAKRDDFITRLCAVAYDAKASAERWEAFLLQIMGGDEQMVRYLQRAVGYSLTGATTEQCLFLLYGAGANGKSTFLAILRALLGPYSTTTDVQTWMAREQRGPSNDLAGLRGVRLVVSSEAEDGARFSEVLLKQVTGGDALRARFLYEEFFEFTPQFKIWLAANHKPVIRGDDHAIWRRMRLIPFTMTVAREQQDRKLEQKLKAELPGVLAWAVRGCVDWQANGLQEPARIIEATDEYRREMDHFGQFLEDECVMGAHRVISAKQLYLAYDGWADEQGIQHKWTMARFGRKLGERGVVRERQRFGVQYRGIALRSHGGDAPGTM